MRSNRAIVRLQSEIAALNGTHLGAAAFRTEAMRRVRRVVPTDSSWFATADPSTLLFTSSITEAIPHAATPLFIENEFLQDDVNKWVSLAKARSPVRSLYDVTEGVPHRSARYRNILEPLGFGDELRAALRTAGACWGFMCLHREASSRAYSAEERTALATIVPLLAHGLRAAVLRDAAGASRTADGPGLLVLANDGTLLSTTPAGDHWLGEIADHPQGHGLPQVIAALAACLSAFENAGAEIPAPTAGVRMQTRSGDWLVAHASRLSEGDEKRTAIILQPAAPAEIAPLLLEAYGMTKREAQVTQHVLRGSTTGEISAQLQITSLTVQQHMKAVFEKTGVGSRRELVARIFSQRSQSATKPPPVA